MRSPITVRQAWRMRGIVVLGAMIGVVGFFAGEAVLTNGAQADGPVREAQSFVTSSDRNGSRPDRVSPAPQLEHVASSDRNGSRPDHVSPAPQLVSAPFRNCAQARAAGAAPVYLGDPGYGEHLDRDRDGVGCEPYRH